MASKTNPQLHFRPFGLIDMPFRVLEHAYWRPQAALLKEKFALEKSSSSDTQKESRIRRTKVAWKREETWINHAFDGLVAGLPSGTVRDWISDLTEGFDVGKAQLASIEYADIRGVTGDPDFILLGQEAVVLGESKVGRHKSSCRYSLDQYSKYMRLAALCRCAVEGRLPSRVVHLLLVPEVDPQKFVSDYAGWKPSMMRNRLYLDPSSMTRHTKRQPFGSYKDWHAHMAATLRSQPVQRCAPMNMNKLEQLLATPQQQMAETYVWSWIAAMDRLAGCCAKRGLDSQALAAREMAVLATGGART